MRARSGRLDSAWHLWLAWAWGAALGTLTRVPATPSPAPALHGQLCVQALHLALHMGSRRASWKTYTGFGEPSAFFYVALFCFHFLSGMRYKRRGVDKNGNVANYVETEQLIHVHNHTLSFIQTRGSVPIFWSQVGYRYNPRPRLDGSKHGGFSLCSGGREPWQV